MITVIGDHVFFRVVCPPNTKSVVVSGTFCEWSRSLDVGGVELTNVGGGAWAGGVRLASGRHEYKLLVDGHWCPDPDSQFQVDDGMGGRNSEFYMVEEPVGTVDPARVGQNLRDWLLRNAYRWPDLEQIANDLSAIGRPDSTPVVAVVGRFKAGKSTFVNALLGTDGHALAPVDDLPATARAAQFRRGAEERFRLWLNDGTWRDSSAEEFRSICTHKGDGVPEHVALRERVVRAVVESPKIEDIGFTVLDTPGFGSGNDCDDRNAVEAARGVAAICVVVGRNTTLTDDIRIRITEFDRIGLPMVLVFAACNEVVPRLVPQIQSHLASIVRDENWTGIDAGSGVWMTSSVDASQSTNSLPMAEVRIRLAKLCAPGLTAAVVRQKLEEARAIVGMRREVVAALKSTRFRVNLMLKEGVLKAASEARAEVARRFPIEVKFFDTSEKVRELLRNRADCFLDLLERSLESDWSAHCKRLAKFGIMPEASLRLGAAQRDALHVHSGLVSFLAGLDRFGGGGPVAVLLLPAYVGLVKDVAQKAKGNAVGLEAFAFEHVAADQYLIAYRMLRDQIDLHLQMEAAATFRAMMQLAEIEAHITGRLNKP